MVNPGRALPFLADLEGEEESSEHSNSPRLPSEAAGATEAVQIAEAVAAAADDQAASQEGGHNTEQEAEHTEPEAEAAEQPEAGPDADPGNE